MYLVDIKFNWGHCNLCVVQVPAKAPLLCTHVAEGHSRAVLSIFATDDLLFSASKGEFCVHPDLVSSPKPTVLLVINHNYLLDSNAAL